MVFLVFSFIVSLISEYFSFNKALHEWIIYYEIIKENMSTQKK